jgi:hypothetical protein
VGTLINLTPYAVGELLGKDAEGLPLFVAAVKATFTWQADGRVQAIEPCPLQEADEWMGEPATSGLLAASELGPPKPRVDVLLRGALTAAAPFLELDVGMRVGARLQKVAKVFGARYWLPGVMHDMVPSKPYPTQALPFAWELCFGGSDPQDTRATEPRNPAGTGVTRRPAELQGKQAPSFEDPGSLIKSTNDRPAPRGFGPVAGHWQPRCLRSGTYDEGWQKSRAPLLPKDFDPAYFNVAPEDQQLPDYQPGEEVRLFNLSPRSVDFFYLPEFEVPVIFTSREKMSETFAQVDTMVIEPAEKRFSLVAHAAFTPRPNLLAMGQAVVGTPTAACLRALAEGKIYRVPRRLRRAS